MITSENISSHELIGLQTQIVESSNKQIVGINGKIVDETKFTFTLSTATGMKKFAKSSSRWKFEYDGKVSELDGSKLTRRPYERIGVRS
ncbi:Ribonuclease P protein component 1 [uncultured archaeon]|nr:Ribonuclease P protein component 1 [uncultured archaeon]